MSGKSPLVTKQAPKDIRRSKRLNKNEGFTSDPCVTPISKDLNSSSGNEDLSDSMIEEQFSCEEKGGQGKSPCPQKRRSIRSEEPQGANRVEYEANVNYVPKGKSTESKKRPNTTGTNAFLGKYCFYILTGSIILISVLVFYGQGYSSKAPHLTIDSIKEKFPNQVELLWKAVSSGLNDTITFNHPTSYVFLHEDRTEETTSNLLKQLSEYAVCQLTNCENTPINFNEVLESKETDYGWIITRYKPELQNSGVMIVENLDQVPEKFALAFHSLCDEISPLVKKSAFFFTMKVNKFHAKPLMDVRYVERTLKEKWKGINDDQFGPLLTRIAAIVLRVHPEEAQS